MIIAKTEVIPSECMSAVEDRMMKAEDAHANTFDEAKFLHSLLAITEAIRENTAALRVIAERLEQ